jgi:hypothetical protein
MMDYIDQKYDILYVDPPWGGPKRVWEDQLTLHLARVEDYSPENEVFHTIASKPRHWKMCAVKVPATMEDGWILEQVTNAFGPVTVNVVTISPVRDGKCGVKLVLIQPKKGGERVGNEQDEKIDIPSFFDPHKPCCTSMNPTNTSKKVFNTFQ